MYTRSARTPPVFLLLLTLAAAAASDAESATYYAARMTIKSATQEGGDGGNSRIVVSTQNQKALINLARGLPSKAKVPANVVLALRIDNCETPAAQWVVYQKDTATELASVSEPFDFPVEPLLKQRNGQAVGSRVLASAQLHPSQTPDYSINGGVLFLSMKSTRKASAADDCPNALTGALLGYVNISFIDRLDGADIPATADALILEGSGFSASRIAP